RERPGEGLSVLSTPTGRVAIGVSQQQTLPALKAPADPGEGDGGDRTEVLLEGCQAETKSR
ncbi:MAG: hypothetical protein ACXWDJ_12720, partial [Aeromicrobium sp.]